MSNIASYQEFLKNTEIIKKNNKFYFKGFGDKFCFNTKEEAEHIAQGLSKAIQF